MLKSKFKIKPKNEFRSRTYLPRRNAFNRPLDTYRPANSYTHYQTPTSYRLVPNSNMKSFNLRNDQSTSNPSNAYRKRPNSDNFEAETESKQVKGIKWVAASGQDVKVSICECAEEMNFGPFVIY